MKDNILQDVCRFTHGLKFKPTWSSFSDHPALDILNWLDVNNVRGDDWTFLASTTVISFRYSEDAVAFKLTWGDIIED